MLGVTEQLVSILSVQQCASCCITASALYNVAVPTQADQRRSSHELCWEVTVKFGSFQQHTWNNVSE